MTLPLNITPHFPVLLLMLDFTLVNIGVSSVKLTPCSWAVWTALDHFSEFLVMYEWRVPVPEWPTHKTQLSQYDHWPLEETSLHALNTRIPVTPREGLKVELLIRILPLKVNLKTHWWSEVMGSWLGPAKRTSSVVVWITTLAYKKNQFLAAHIHTRGSLCALW